MAAAAANVRHKITFLIDMKNLCGMGGVSMKALIHGGGGGGGGCGTGA